MRDETICLTVIALMIPAFSYFTTYAVARGGHPLYLEPEVTVEEDFASWVKTLQITKTGEGEVFVRAQAIAGTNVTLSYSGSGWTNGGDGYYYYNTVLTDEKPATEVLNISISAPTAIEEGDEFHVVVVYEFIPARYRSDGTAYADWEADNELVTLGEGGN